MNVQAAEASLEELLQALHADHEKAAPETAPMPLIQTMFAFSGTESYSDVTEDGIGFCSTRVRAQKPILTTAMPKMALIRSVR